MIGSLVHTAVKIFVGILSFFLIPWWLAVIIIVAAIVAVYSWRYHH